MRRWKFFLAGLIVYSIAIFGIAAIENKNADANIQSASDALWYAIVTLTTVGYGDFYPVTPWGKIIGLTLIIGSIGVLGFIIGEITTRFNQYMEKKKNGYWGTDFKNHYLIIGWNEFGRQVADQILNTGHKVAIVVNSKNDLELINDIYPKEKCFCMFSDFNNWEAYKKVNIIDSKGVYINIEEDTDTLVFVIGLKNEYPGADIVVTCKNPELKETFKKAGIKHVVAQSEVAARLVASYIFEPHVAAYTEDLITTSAHTTEFDIQEYLVTDANPYLGKKYLDSFIDLKTQYEVVLIGMVIDGEVCKNPDKNYTIKKGDYFILISDGDCKPQLQELFGIHEGE